MHKRLPLLAALAFGLACALLLGGRVAQARGAPPSAGPVIGELTLGPAAPIGPASPGGLGGLVLTTTAGLNPGVCAVTQAITVPAGTLVTFCYQVRNTGSVTLTAHTLRDQLTDPIIADYNFSLPPGAVALLTRTLPVYGSVNNLATWSATKPITSYTIGVGSCGVFPDISATGQALNLGDDEAANITLPFEFLMYDRYSDRLRVSNNGAAVLDSPTTGIGFGNQALPASALPHGFALFWDDLDARQGNVYAGVFTFTAAMQAQAAQGGQEVLLPPGPAPQGGEYGYYVIEYKQRPHYGGPLDGGAFALALLAPGSGTPGFVVMCYQDTDFGNAIYNNGASATIGLNHNGGAATQFSFNTAHPELMGDAGVSFTPAGSGQTGLAAGSAARVYAQTVVNLPLVNK
ncbi:MAG: hypothetical protein IT317_20850 [Anaerolineales bacterium]|nr:hypothetical protein [Anaerolineales bacterium]